MSRNYTPSKFEEVLVAEYNEGPRYPGAPFRAQVTGKSVTGEMATRYHIEVLDDVESGKYSKLRVRTDLTKIIPVCGEHDTREYYNSNTDLWFCPVCKR